MQDPFDDVLKALRLDEEVQKSPPAAIETQGVAPLVSCRVQVMDSAEKAAAIERVPSAVRISWALQLIKFIHPTPATASQTRPMNIILKSDGTVHVGPTLAGKGTDVYPARYRIPPSTIKDLTLHEQVWRAEKFALGVLLYEIFTGQTPFEGIDDDEVQAKYSKADFPQNLDSIQPRLQMLIYACWSADFGHYITLNIFQKYVVDNPLLFGLQVASGFVGLGAAAIAFAALITVPVLGVVGFGVLGPVAGSAAAAWQASIGAVEAGSLFAICQSAAMGGSAATGLTITGGTGLAITGANGLAITGTAAAAAMAASQSLRNIFIQKFRKPAKEPSPVPTIPL